MNISRRRRVEMCHDQFTEYLKMLYKNGKTN
jgi:hypothetical protein